MSWHHVVGADSAPTASILDNKSPEKTPEEGPVARPRDPANSLYQAGPVRVVNRKPRGYRILWTEGNRQRERGANTLERTKQIAHDEAARLWTEDGQLATADITGAFD